MKTEYIIKECDYFYREGDNKSDNKRAYALPKEIFDTLENFVLENKEEDDDEYSEFLYLKQKKGYGKILKAKNYVGVIQTDQGITIEILPKLYCSENEENIRKILLEMLKSLKESPFKKINLANLHTHKFDLFDIFINMFLEELSKLIKNGIKRGYIPKKENSNFFRGKLLINKHINNNFIHKERFFVKYEEFTTDRPENRLIKSTLNVLREKTNSRHLQKNLNQYLFIFDNVGFSKNYESDFSKCRYNRKMKDYQLLLEWCSIFLKEKSFLSQKGQNIAYSLLFPMERIFEDYVAYSIKRHKMFFDFDIEVQEKNYSLFDIPERFYLKPDIVLKKDKQKILIDTKWKILDEESSNYGISQSDMYQMYAYAKKYNADKIVLVYPYSKKTKNILKKDDDLCFISYEEDKNVEINIFFIKLDQIDKTLSELFNKII